jgi:hypothetical protein
MTSTTWREVGGRDTGGDAAKHPAARASGRIGLAARGVLYVVMGILAIRLASGERDERADKSGALALVARQPFGKVLLVVLACGFGAYALWMVVRVFAVDDDGDRNTAKAWGKRAAYVARIAIYCALAFSAVDALSRSAGTTKKESSQQEKEWTARVLEWPFGRFLVVAAGVAIVAGGLAYFYRGFTQKWREHLDLARTSPRTRKAVVATGLAGWIGRGVVFSLVGVFVVRAAVQFDEKDAVGLDGALRELADGTLGRWLMVLGAVGLLAFGCYSLLEARYRRVDDA